MRETLYGHCKALQTSGFVNCFIHKISLSNRELDHLYKFYRQVWIILILII